MLKHSSIGMKFRGWCEDKVLVVVRSHIGFRIAMRTAATEGRKAEHRGGFFFNFYAMGGQEFNSLIPLQINSLS